MPKTLLKEEHSKQMIMQFLELAKPLKPPLKWAGGKRRLVPYLLPILKQYQPSRLVEPFCGGLAIALALMPKDALLNDINPHLINFYQWLKKGFYIETAMKNDEAMYYLYRDRFNKLIKKGKYNTEEAASLFYYLNKTGFNGLCRFNNSGEFNTPFGEYKTINYKRDFSEYKDLFSKFIFSYDDFEKLQITPNDVIYADPPYDVEFTKYAKENFLWEDQERLANWLSKQSCPIVTSNQATKRIIQLYLSHGFDLAYVNAPRRISCTGDRTPAKEIIATKNI